MSTIAITAPFDGTHATRLRLTRRGQRVLAAVVAVPAAVALSAALLAGGTAIAGRDIPAAASFETVKAMPGDSLWTIAQQVAPAEDPRDVVGAFLRLNALSSVELEAGQELAVPAQYTASR